MEFEDYQRESANTAIYPDHGECSPDAITYVTLGLIGEAGELANKWKKFFRDGITANTPDDYDYDPAVLEEYKSTLKSELGDVLWYVAQLATELGVPLEQIAEENLSKLQSRQARGMLHGSGDYR